MEDKGAQRGQKGGGAGETEYTAGGNQTQELKVRVFQRFNHFTAMMSVKGLKTTNASAKSETLQPLFVFRFSHCYVKGFHLKRIALKVDVL